MKTFNEWLVENSMNKAAGYLIDGKAFCPGCARRPLTVPPDAVPLTPSKLKKVLQGSRPEADSAAVNSKPGGPSYKCNGDCGRRFMNEGSWQHSEFLGQDMPWFSATVYGEWCEGCYNQLDRDHQSEQRVRVAHFGEMCGSCERTSTGWEWVKTVSGTEEQRSKELQRMGF
jgi:hypothetical protein